VQNELASTLRPPLRDLHLSVMPKMPGIHARWSEGLLPTWALSVAMSKSSLVASESPHYTLETDPVATAELGPGD
jgi:hypothetical protein